MFIGSSLIFILKLIYFYWFFPMELSLLFIYLIKYWFEISAFEKTASSWPLQISSIIQKTLKLEIYFNFWLTNFSFLILMHHSLFDWNYSGLWIVLLFKFYENIFLFFRCLDRLHGQVFQQVISNKLFLNNLLSFGKMFLSSADNGHSKRSTKSLSLTSWVCCYDKFYWSKLKNNL